MRKIFTLIFLSVTLHGTGQISPYSDIIGNDILFDSVKNILRQGGPEVAGITPRSGNLTALNVQKTDSGVFRSKRIVCNGHRCLNGNSEPLLVIDGVQAELEFLVEFDPNEIKCLEVLKPAPATAIFGPDGANGAILIQTKRLFDKFIIKDLLDGSPIGGATLSFISADNKDKMMYMANDSGMVITDDLKKSAKYIMTVSAVGHQTLKQVFENSYNVTGNEIVLAREIKTCGEVVVSTGHGFGCCRTCFTIYKQEKSVTTVIAYADKKEHLPVAPFGFKVYPNPVQRGAVLNLQFNNDDGMGKFTRIISLDGKPLLEEILPANTGLTHFTIVN
jgi:TonB-dependent SusC/RagA subfamily outer membrane receptor